MFRRLAAHAAFLYPPYFSCLMINEQKDSAGEKKQLDNK